MNVDELFPDNILIAEDVSPKTVVVEDEVDPEDVKRDLLNNLINGSYNVNAINLNKTSGKPTTTGRKKGSTNRSDMTIATRDPKLSVSRLNSVFVLFLITWSLKLELLKT